MSARIAERIGPVRRATRRTASRSSACMRKHANHVDRIDPTLVEPRAARRRARLVGRRAPARRPQNGFRNAPGHGARADRHHRLHDGLRHDRHRARHRAREVQEARRRRRAQDREQHGPARARRSSATPRRRSPRSCSSSTRWRRSRARRELRDEHLPGVRLRVQAAERRALDPLHGPHPHDGRGPAVPLGRDLEDRQHADATRRRRTSRTRTSRRGSSASRRSRSTATAASGASRSTPARTKEEDKAERPPASRARAAPAPRRARVDHAQVLDRRPRGLHDRRHVRRRHAGRDLRHDGEGGLGRLRPHGRFATAISMALQYGVPLQVLCDKFSHTRFEPSGFTGNPDIPIAKSIIGLHVPLARAEVPPARGRRRSRPPQRAHAGRRARRAVARARPRQLVEARPLPAVGAGERPTRTGRADIADRRYKRETRRPALPDLRLDHGAERRLLQVRELRVHDGLQLARGDAAPGTRLRSTRAGADRPLRRASSVSARSVTARGRRSPGWRSAAPPPCPVEHPSRRVARRGDRSRTFVAEVCHGDLRASRSSSPSP